MYSLTQTNTNDMLKSQAQQTQSPLEPFHDQYPHDPNSNISGLGSPRASSVLLRPLVIRRTSTITWEEMYETNAISVPPLLKKEVARSKAGHTKPAVEKFASWFKDSPENLEELEEAKDDDHRWKRKVRKWKKERRLSQESGSDRVDDKKEESKLKRWKRRLLCT